MTRLDKVVGSVFIIVLFLIAGVLISETKSAYAQEPLQELISLPFFRGMTPKVYRFIDRGNTCYVIVAAGKENASITCVK